MKVTSDREKYTQFELFRLRCRLPPRRRRVGTRIASECVPGGNGITTDITESNICQDKEY